MVEDVKYMNAKAHMCACQLWLYFFPGCETLPQVFQRNGIEWWPYSQAVLVPSVPMPPAAWVLAVYCPPSHPPRPIVETRICFDRCLYLARPVSGAGLHS